MKTKPSNNNPNQKPMNKNHILENQSNLEIMLHQEADEHFKVRDLRVLKACLEHVLGGSNDPVSDHIRGMVYSNNGHQKEAIPILRRAVAGMPDKSEHKTSLGIALFKNGDVNEAEKVQEEAVAMAPDDAFPLTNLAWTLLALKKSPVRAEKLLRRARKIEPNNPSILANLGIALLTQNRQEEAFLAFFLAIMNDQSGEICRKIPKGNPDLDYAANRKLAKLAQAEGDRKFQN